jgi:hypothetical protein
MGMEHEGMHAGPRPRAPGRVRRLIIWGFIIAVPWVPAIVALAMILTGNLGR